MKNNDDPRAGCAPRFQPYSECANFPPQHKTLGCASSMSSSTSSGSTDPMPRRGRGAGLLPAQAIRALIAEGRLSADAPIADTQIQPASLDLRLGAKAFRVRASFLPGREVSVADKLAQFALHEIDLRPGAVLETGCVYVAPLLERLALPPDVSALANPKSSTGRLDVFTRVIANGGSGFDQAPRGYAGPLYAEICPQTFPVLVRTGSSLAQIRFRRGEDEAPGRRPARSPPGVVARLAGRCGGARRGVPANVFLSVDLGGDGVVRLSGQALHGPDRHRPGRRMRHAPISGSPYPRPNAASFSIRTSSTFSPRRRPCMCLRPTPPR